VTFRQLATDAQLALHAEDTALGERALELMIDLARDAEGGFRSEDPLEAAKFALSHAVSALLETVLAEHGFARFAERAAPRARRTAADPVEVSVRLELRHGRREGPRMGDCAD
jgi:hypothetical protein